MLEAGITREAAFELLKEHNQDPFHLEHGQTVGGVLEYFAKEFDPENTEFWYVCGLLHDVDWEEFPTAEEHTIAAAKILAEAGGTEQLIHSIQTHTYGHPGERPAPELMMEKVLFAVDELTGLIGAAVIMRPSKSVMDFEVKSLKKKFKDKRFAAGCSRDIIRTGAEYCGWELDELFTRTIDAMKAIAPDRDTFVAAE